MESEIYRELTESEIVLRTINEARRAFDFHTKNLQRSVENWRFYWGLDGEKGLGQWPAEAVAELMKEGRQICTYNFCRPIVDGIAGGIMKAPMSINYSPVNDEESSLTYAIKNMQYSDWELMDCRSHLRELIIAGLTFRGDWEMYISKEYDQENGNIGFRYLLPGTVTYDPNWRSPRSKDCRKAFKKYMLTPIQMMELFCEKKDDIVSAVLFKKYGKNALKALAEWNYYNGDEYGENYGVYPFPFDNEMWGNQYEVIECYHMEKVKHKVTFVKTEHNKKIYIPSELKTPEEKIQWLNLNVPDWVPDQVFEDDRYEDIQYKTITCPDLSTSFWLGHGATEIQCGRLQFFPWSAARVNGEEGGIIDVIKDAQITINYWSSLLTYKIQTEGGSGSQFVEREAFVSDAEYFRYIAERNNPSAVFEMKRGFMSKYPNGPAIPTVKSPFPAEAMQQLQQMIDVILPRISKWTPASQGRSENSGESGYLYRLKAMQSQIEQFVIYEGLRSFMQEIGEAYYFQAQITYGNQVERQFKDGQSGQVFLVNKRETRQDSKGNWVEVIVNDIAQLKEKRHKVIVVESEDSPMRKIEVLETATDLLNQIGQEKPLLRQELIYLQVKQLDVFDSETKQRLARFHEEEMELAYQMLKTQKAKLRMEEQQASAPPQPQMPMGNGQGSPVPQGGTNPPSLPAKKPPVVLDQAAMERMGLTMTEGQQNPQAVQEQTAQPQAV